MNYLEYKKFIKPIRERTNTLVEMGGDEEKTKFDVINYALDIIHDLLYEIGK